MSAVNPEKQASPGFSDWLIVGFSAASTIAYFLTSYGVKGEFQYVFDAAMKVLTRLGLIT